MKRAIIVEGLSLLKLSPSLVLLFLQTLTALAVLGEPPTPDPDTQRLCAAVQDVELPPGDRPTAEEEKSLAACVSLDLYFGFGQQADPVKARKCAYAEMKRGEKDQPFAGRTILMMVYANGKGAARNLDVALKLGCEIGGAPFDIAGRVHELAHFREERWTGNNFSICGHSAGKFMYDQCAILEDRFDKVQRDKRLHAIVASWSAGDRLAFQALDAKAREFFKARVSMEIDLSGTLEVHETAFLERDLIATLERFANGDLPRFSAAAQRDAEAAMNASYNRTQKGTISQWGTVSREGIRKAQQAWVSYRDAWVKFGRMKYSGVSAESWKTWLTQQRIAMLDRFQR